MDLEHIETILNCIDQPKRLEEDKQSQQAISLYRQVIELDPRNLDALQGIGNIYFITEDYNSALDSYIAAIHVDSSKALLHFQLGRVARKQNRLEDALASYNYATKLSPDDFRFHQEIGDLQFEKKQFQLAEISYRKSAQQSKSKQVPAMEEH